MEHAVAERWLAIIRVIDTLSAGQGEPDAG